ncbi:MAG: anthranilate synthase component I family protein, partial [Pseudohongiellaceae bacterium]
MEDIFEQELPYPESVTQLFSRFRQLELPVLLSSGSNLDIKARYDIISAAPATVLSTRGKQTHVKGAGAESFVSQSNPVDVLQDCFPWPQMNLAVPERFPFIGGAIGYLAYELLHNDYRIEPSCHDDIQMPAMLFGIYHWAIVVDHQEQNCHLVILASCSARIRETVLACLKSEAPSGPGEFHLSSRFQSNFSEPDYTLAFKKIIDYIHAGDCYQVNLAQRYSAEYAGDPFAAFIQLSHLANAPFSAYLEAESGAVLSFSPERFLRVKNGQVMTQPIKGTRSRHEEPGQDQALLQDLVNSKKDQAENLMIVDLLRNDLGRVCKTGSVHVPALFQVQSFRNVHHLVSTIAGQLQQGSDVFALLKAGFPGGSITGTPKIRAMEIINELE